MPNDKTTIYVASAGTGKTTTLMDLLSKCLETTAPNQICFTTFTKAGATEAIERALARNPKLNEKDFTAFSTLHALCFRRIERKQMLNLQDYKLLGELSGYTMTGVSSLYDKQDTTSMQTCKGDRLLQYNSLMRNMQQSAADTLVHQINTKFTPDELERFNELYKQFKQEKNKYDFTDQLEVFLDRKIKLGVKFLFVDEAQDLSPLQWQIVNHISNEVEQVYIAGDDKQSIYKFSGGDPSSLINKKGNRIVLDTSYRLPTPVLDYAEKICDKITEKQPYEVHSKQSDGAVHKIRTLDDLDFTSGTWFLLARNKALLPLFEQYLVNKRILFVSGGSTSLFKEKQIPFIKLWEKLRLGYKFKASELKELYREYLPCGPVVKRGSKNLIESMPDNEMYDKDDLVNNFGLKTLAKWNEVFKLSDLTKSVLLQAEADNKLDDATNIEVNTIHASKGREAENVVVLPDMTSTSFYSYNKDPDNEHRVFYVACTRAKKNLYLHTPLTQRFYPLP